MGLLKDKLTITWYLKPEDMRILVVPKFFAQSLLVLICLVVIIPTVGATYLHFGEALHATNTVACSDESLKNESLVADTESPKVLGRVATSEITNYNSRPGRTTETRSDSIASILPNHTVNESDIEKPKLEEEDLNSDVGSIDLNESETVTESIPPENTAPGVLPLVDISQVSFELESGGDLSIQFEIRNLARTEVSGTTWAVATFVSIDGSRIHIPTHPKILSDRVTAIENQKNGVSFKAKALTIKQFNFAPPQDIDGEFKSVTIVAMPLRALFRQKGLSSDQVGLPIPAIRRIALKDR